MTKIFNVLAAVLVATMVSSLAACGGGEEPFPDKSVEKMPPEAVPGSICVKDSGCTPPGSDYNSIRRRNIGVVTPDRHCSVDYPGAAACMSTAVQNCRTCSDGHKVCNWNTIDPPPEMACQFF